MKINLKVKGIDDLDKKINNICQQLPNTSKNSLEEGLKNITSYAIRLRRGNKTDGILVEMIKTDTKEIKGRIYTDQEKFPYSWFEHFGTGRYAELPHVGTSKHFIESGYEEWYIPVNKVDRALHYPIINIQGQDFYLAHGVEANPFLQKAEFEMRGDTLDTVQDGIYAMLREVCK